jgi:hypothetical protein
MTISKLSRLGLGVLLGVVAHVAPAQAQLARTWVSGTGNDANPCSRTQPCATLAGAHAVTMAGGEISVLDPGGIGSVTITKPITINGEGTLAGITTSGGNAINVLAGASDKVIISNLTLNGSAFGANAGVNVISGHVTIEKCLIYGFTAGILGGHGVLVNTSAGTTRVDIRDTNISNTSNGVWVQTSGGFVTVTLDNVRINGTNGFGVITNSSNVFVSVNRSMISHAGTALHTNTGAGVINLSNSHVSNNTTGMNAASAGSTIRINGNAIFHNATAFMIAAGAFIATGNNNKTAANGGVTVPNATIGTQ